MAAKPKDRAKKRQELMDQSASYLHDIDEVLDTPQPKNNPGNKLGQRRKKPRSVSMPKALADELDKREIQTEVK